MWLSLTALPRKQLPSAFITDHPVVMHSRTTSLALPFLCQPPVGPPPIYGFYLGLHVGILLRVCAR